MIGRALNAQNDIVLLDGRIAVVDGGDETAQHVRTRLLFYLGEWFLDTDAGTPWFEEVFVKPVNLPNVESIIKGRILTTEGITRLNKFAMSFDSISRRLEVVFSASTEFGELEDTQLIINSILVTHND